MLRQDLLDATCQAGIGNPFLHFVNITKKYSKTRLVRPLTSVSPETKNISRFMVGIIIIYSFPVALPNSLPIKYSIYFIEWCG